MMKICKEFLTYEITKEVVAFTSRRGSGVTKNAYSPIATFLSLPDEKVIIPHQTHSDNIQVIDNHFFLCRLLLVKIFSKELMPR